MRWSCESCVLQGANAPHELPEAELTSRRTLRWGVVARFTRCRKKRVAPARRGRAARAYGPDRPYFLAFRAPCPKYLTPSFMSYILDTLSCIVDTRYGEGWNGSIVSGEEPLADASQPDRRVRLLFRHRIADRRGKRHAAPSGPVRGRRRRAGDHAGRRACRDRDHRPARRRG